jgi:muramoyltetrapeptide carboxypeptidase
LLEAPVHVNDTATTETYATGVAEGRLLGGNLSVLSRVIGTAYMPLLEDTVLLLEDQGERPYRLDRMWTHLELAGVFGRIKGIVLGSFTQCEEPGAPYSSAEVLRELAAATGVPCAAGFPIGHGEANEPVPLGVRVRLDAGAQRLSFWKRRSPKERRAAALRAAARRSAESGRCGHELIMEVAASTPSGVVRGRTRAGRSSRRAA